MEVNKKRLAEIFGVSIRTIHNWQEQGMPVSRGGGKGNEVMYDSAAIIEWYSVRVAAIENQKMRKVVEELRIASESNLQHGTIQYERHRLTRSQADAHEFKNAREIGEVIDTAFAAYAMSKLAREVEAIMERLPFAICRQFPSIETRYLNVIKREVNKAMNCASRLAGEIPGMAKSYIAKNKQ
ncbi:terminase small subunit [Escherichia coli]